MLFRSSAVVDFDGDCLADIFLLCKPSSPFTPQSYQIWLNNKDDGYKLASTGSFPRNIGQITFADMDRDGTIDMVWPSCYSLNRDTGIGTDCHINIAYNRQKPLCSGNGPLGKSSSKCRTPEDLCSADPNFTFEFNESDPEVRSYYRLPARQLINTARHLPGFH